MNTDGRRVHACVVTAAERIEALKVARHRSAVAPDNQIVGRLSTGSMQLKLLWLVGWQAPYHTDKHPITLVSGNLCCEGDLHKQV